MTKLAGIFTPTVVPLGDQGHINEGELRRYVDWLIDVTLYNILGYEPEPSTLSGRT